MGLLEGSSTKILVMRFLAFSEILTCSGNIYWPALIFLYVALTSGVSNGGFPMSWVYLKF